MTTEEYTEDELYNYLKELPDFERLSFPESWYKKFNIKLLKPDNFKEVIESGYCEKALLETGGLVELPAPKDYKFPELKVEEIPLEVKTNMLEDKKE